MPFTRAVAMTLIVFGGASLAAIEAMSQNSAGAAETPRYVVSVGSGGEVGADTMSASLQLPNGAVLTCRTVLDMGSVRLGSECATRAGKLKMAVAQ